MTPRVSPAPAAPVLRYGATRGGCARRGPGVVPGGVDRPVAGDQQLIIHATRVSDLWHMARHQMLAMCRHGDNTQSSHLTHDGTKMQRTLSAFEKLPFRFLPRLSGQPRLADPTRRIG